MQMIEAKSLQPNVGNDMALLDKTYDIARQTIGITDSFQGRRDTTAVSGKVRKNSRITNMDDLNAKHSMKNKDIAL